MLLLVFGVTSCSDQGEPPDHVDAASSDAVPDQALDEGLDSLLLDAGPDSLLPDVGLPPPDSGAPSSGWTAEAYTSLPSEFAKPALIWSHPTGGITAGRVSYLQANYKAGTQAPWGLKPGGANVPHLRLSVHTSAADRLKREDRPYYRHTVKLKDTVHDLEFFVPAVSDKAPEPRSAIPLQVNWKTTNTILLRWHMWASDYRGIKEAGKRVSLCLGRGIAGAGNFQLSAAETFGSTDGTAFVSMSPTIASGQKSGIGTLVDHNSGSVKDKTYGETANGTKVAYTLNRWITVDQILKMNSPGKKDGFWKLRVYDPVKGNYERGKSDVEFSPNPPVDSRAAFVFHRHMHGGTPLSTDAKPIRFYTEDYGGFYLYLGSWKP